VVHVHPIIFADAALDEMKFIAATTSGTGFDAKANSLQSVFQQIRGFG